MQVPCSSCKKKKESPVLVETKWLQHKLAYRVESYRSCFILIYWIPRISHCLLRPCWLRLADCSWHITYVWIIKKTFCLLWFLVETASMNVQHVQSLLNQKGNADLLCWIEKKIVWLLGFDLLPFHCIEVRYVEICVMRYIFSYHQRCIMYIVMLFFFLFCKIWERERLKRLHSVICSICKELVLGSMFTIYSHVSLSQVIVVSIGWHKLWSVVHLFVQYKSRKYAHVWATFFYVAVLFHCCFLDQTSIFKGFL